jgi:hypothetical protein
MSRHIVSPNSRRDNCAPNAVDRHATRAPTRAAPFGARRRAHGFDADTHRPLAEAADIKRLLWRLDQIAHVLSISRRVLERERSTGQFPAPDLIFGRMHLRRPERIQAWIGGGA